MANFGGHAIPGGFFLLFGLWLTVKYVLTHHWRRHKARGRPVAPPFLKKMNYVEGGLAGVASFVGELLGRAISAISATAGLCGATLAVPPQVSWWSSLW